MFNKALIQPESIAIVGASNNPGKPGSRLIMNLIEGGYKGMIYPVNPYERQIHGLRCYNALDMLPTTDLAILALPAAQCVEAVEELTLTNATRAFIIISAGFAETGEEGLVLENRLKGLAEEHSLALIGPNCIGILNATYRAIFVASLPTIKEGGVDFVSASGALAVFIFEVAAKQGVQFGSVYSVGNSVTIGIEEVLQYWEESFVPGQSGRVKLVYTEQIRKPALFFNSIHSLRRKGCQVVVLKPGDSEAGVRAALSHTGSLAGDKEASNYLIQKAGAIRCYSREELVYLAGILSQSELKGKNLAIITHAGGPAVMLADQLQQEGFQVPEIDADSQKQMLTKLHPGSSAINPVDILATANREQLAFSVTLCGKLRYIDGIIVIYGKTGLEDLYKTYTLLDETIRKCKKPVYAVLPSVYSGREEIEFFTGLGQVAYADEVLLAKCLGKVYPAPGIFKPEIYLPPAGEMKKPAKLVLGEAEVMERLKSAGIPHVTTWLIQHKHDLDILKDIHFPVVAKVMGVLHKTEYDGVILNINGKEELFQSYKKLMEIRGATGILIQEMLSGMELYLGGKKHAGIGYSVHAGLGGIFIELVKESVSTLAPVSYPEALQLLSTLKAQQIFAGFRNRAAVDKNAFARLLVTFSHIFLKYPDIAEIDLNPLIASGKRIIAVDARIIVDDNR